MPARPRTSDLRILLAAGGVTLLLSILSFFVAPVDSIELEDGSSYSAGPGGAKAAFLMLKESGYSVERSFEPLTALRANPDRTVLLLARPSQLPSQQDVKALRAFVEAGGVVVSTDEPGAAFLPGVPRRIGRSAAAGPAARVDASIVSPLTAGVPSVQMRTASTAVPADSPYVPVYGHDRAPAVVMARFGRGVAVWWADSTPLSNAAIRSPGHAELLINTVGAPGERVVLWDEFYHGHSRSVWSYLADTPLPLAGMQLGLVAIAALFTWSRRKWPVRALPVEPRTSPLEFVDSMGGLYQRAGVTLAVVATVRSRVRRALCMAVRLPPSSDDGLLSATVAARSSVDAKTAKHLLAESADFPRRISHDPGEALRIVAGLQRLAIDVQELRRSRPVRPAMRSTSAAEGERT